MKKNRSNNLICIKYLYPKNFDMWTETNVSDTNIRIQDK